MCSNMAKFLAVRIAQMDVEKLEDNEKTFSDLYGRIDKSIEILKSIKPDSINASDQRIIHVETPLTTFDLDVVSYVTLYAIPNFFFHSTTAYAILRNQGVPLSKLHFAAFQTTGSKMKA